MDREDSINRTKKFWDRESGTWEIGRGIRWTELAAVHERLNRKIAGDMDVNLLLSDFLRSRGFVIPAQRCLTLGCGAGDFERLAAKHNFCLRHDAFDISEGAIEKAKNKAREEGFSHISYEARDINTISLAPEMYDAVFGISSVHHFSNLEHIFSEVRKALKPGGFFILHEFVGPTKFQWTDKQLRIINGALQILPDRYCLDRRDGVTIKKRHWRPTVEEMDSVDPSEAIRSAEILTVLPAYFEILLKKDLGGTILHLLLDGIAGNFDHKNRADMRLLHMLFEIEDAFMEAGEIQSDFAFIIARKP